MDLRALVLAVIAMPVAACSPFGGGAFNCTQDEQCGAGGTCSSGGYCSFEDSSCPSGQRYGGLSGSMSNTCVGGTPVDAGGSDIDIDAFEFLDARVPMDGTYCYGTGLAVACFVAPPTGMITLQAQQIDTGNSALCSTTVIDNPPWCVIAANTITVATGTVTVTGARPLVLIAVGTLDVTGTLSVASTRTGTEVIGASADYASCNAGTPPTATKGGGGAGGSFGGNGGDGGDGNGAATHGTHGAKQTATQLRGGCPGQDGDGGHSGGRGHGGGALALIANGQITVEGNVNASGEAGQGGAHPTTGGGGGGAGGLIILDAPTVTVTGAVFANGGGGAEGSGVTTNDGANGNDPTVTGAAQSANTSSGGQGGAGGVGANADGMPGTGPDTGGQTGGGGGGGVGFIVLSNATTIAGGGTISPPHS